MSPTANAALVPSAYVGFSPAAYLEAVRLLRIRLPAPPLLHAAGACAAAAAAATDRAARCVTGSHLVPLRALRSRAILAGDLVNLPFLRA